MRWLGLPVFAGAVALLGRDGALLGNPDAQVLWARSDPLTEDVDLDGLCLHQENILGTADDDPDSDGDFAEDLIEVARGTDPTNAVSIPGPQSVSVGMTARAEGPTLTLVTAIYSSFAEFPTFGLQMGAVLGDVEVQIPLSQVLKVSKLTLHPGMDPSGWIIVLEMKVPSSLFVPFGSVGVYTKIYETGNPVPEKAAVLNLIMIEGQPVLLLPAPDTMQAGTIYQPLGRGEDIPASWTTGKVCWQLTNPVGTDGSSILLDVEAASCEDLDSTCSSASCSASVGTLHKVLDAGALAGGG